MADIDDEVVRVWTREDFRPLMEMMTDALATADFIRDRYTAEISQRPAFSGAAGADTVSDRTSNDGVPLLTKAEIVAAMGHIQSLATLLTTAEVRELNKGRVRTQRAR